MTNINNNAAAVSSSTNAAEPKNKRVGIFANFATKQKFYDAAEELQSAVESGAVSKDNVFYKWVTSPEILEALDNLKPNSSSEPEVGFGQWDEETAQKVKDVLNKRIVDFTKAETIATIICGVTVENFRNLDETVQDVAKTSALNWVRANTADDGIFIAKKGRGGGTALRISL